MPEFELTTSEIKDIQTTSVYSFAFEDIINRIAKKYNLVWDIDSKEFKQAPPPLIF